MTTLNCDNYIANMSYIQRKLIIILLFWCILSIMK